MEPSPAVTAGASAAAPTDGRDPIVDERATASSGTQQPAAAQRRRVAAGSR